MKWIFLILILFTFFKDSEASKCGCKTSYKRVGCYKDVRGKEALPEMLLTERDRYSKLYSGYDIQWMNWANYMPALVCRCAKKALENGYKYFGIEFWGECWSGPSPAADLEYSTYGNGTACHGPTYDLCDEKDANCVGASSHIFVYELVNYTCDLHFEKIGCYNDRYRYNNLALTARDRSSGVYIPPGIDWWNYDIFLPEFACECAKRTAAMGYKTFGLQYYGECWTGERMDNNHFLWQGESHRCINKCYKDCSKWEKFCMGEHHTNTIYRIMDPANCGLQYTSLGCFNANDTGGNLAMPELLLNEWDPSSDAFFGNILELGDTWEAKYLGLLCRCAHAAEMKGFENFAIKNHGECWSGWDSGNSYNQFGVSDECVGNLKQAKSNETAEFEKCHDEIKCAGNEHSISVYNLVGDITK